jgi:hypothetical protein
MQVKLSKNFYIRALIKVWFIQNSRLLRVQFSQISLYNELLLSILLKTPVNLISNLLYINTVS